MDMRNTMQMYPRLDTYFRDKSSLDFDMMRSKIILERRGGGKESLILWLSHVVVGVLMGFIAFMLTYVEDEIVNWRKHTL